MIRYSIHHFRNPSCCPALIVAATWLSMLNLSAGADVPVPRVQQVFDQLTTWTDSLSSIYIRCQWSFDKDTLASEEIGAAPADVAVSMDLEWAWTDRGQLRYNRADKADDEIASRQLIAIDGDRSYRFEFPDGETDATKPDVVTVAPAPPGITLLIEPLYGLWFGNQSKWLGTLIREGKVRLSSDARENEEESPVLQVERSPGIFLTLTLDSAHGMLPVKVREGTGNVVFESRVEEFRELAPRLWFPWSGVLETIIGGEVHSRKRWRMTKVTVNQPLSRNLFRPAIPIGVRVHDAFSGKQYYQGGVVPQSSLPAFISQTPPSATVSGVPEAGTHKLTVLFLGAAVMFFIAAYVHRRRSA